MKKILLFMGMLSFIVVLAGCGSHTSLSQNKSSSLVSSGKVTSEISSSQSDSSQPALNGSVSSQQNNNWVVYDTNKDGYKLHIKKKDGKEDKVIVNDAVLAPCLVDDWVYYIVPLQEIDKVKLDGSQKTKVCNVDAMEALNANAAVTAEFKDGSVLYKLVQLRESGDSRPNTETYYKLDTSLNKITPVN